MRLNDRSPRVEQELEIKYHLGRFQARVTAKDWRARPTGRYKSWMRFGVDAWETLREYKSPSHTQVVGHWGRPCQSTYYITT